jgi:nucleoside 2-deoxyribosyltransferase-like protein
MRVYLAGPIFSQAERDWLDRLAGALRDEGFDCFVPHEHLGEITEPTPEAIYELDATALRGSDAMLAWLDGPIVDDGTAAEIGAFAELVRSDNARYRGIVGLVTDLRLQRRRGRAPGDGLNLFVAGAIVSNGRICWSSEEAIAALGELRAPGTLADS